MGSRVDVPEEFGTPADDHRLAAELAAGAGRLLLAVRAERALSGAALGAAGDAVAHQWLARALVAHRPGDALLSEEGAADPARLDASRVWIVDPLDGTREYAEGRADWAVHVCLAVDGVPVAAAVALPDREAVHTTGVPTPLAPAPEGPLRVLVSRSRPPAAATEVAGRLGAELVPMGSAGAKAMAVLTGEAHAYVHAGGQYEWDSAAPAGAAAAAGLHVSRLDGSPLRYNRPDPYLPDLLVCRPELAGELLDALRTTAGVTGTGERDIR
ncbi:3'(2'),5'-bisphosphate nucleotidase CysQ [Streptomyces sp. HU2014]|uniref:3'(2'),5'-bisphosphate nucleotidase CysQ n=1 Tax=Streptomyces sp. HU2014 TaxID=2939414 RepID=UPI0024B3387D|nr:3'(2'),5'-bisphosphate nucleotidase CysQ [Streptomyces sp. HU2014]